MTDRDDEDFDYGPTAYSPRAHRNVVDEPHHDYGDSVYSPYVYAANDAEPLSNYGGAAPLPWEDQEEVKIKPEEALAFGASVQHLGKHMSDNSQNVTDLPGMIGRNFARRIGFCSMKGNDGVSDLAQKRAERAAKGTANENWADSVGEDKGSGAARGN